MSLWPEKFRVLRDGFQENFGDRTISSNMDIGPAKKRRRTMLESSTLTFSTIVTNDDYPEFREFYFDNDVGIIDFKRPDSGQVVKCRFASVPNATFNESMWSISVTLEIMP